jgi:hypothetical protein
LPKLYEYMGIIVFFYSNEHQPVHVHGRYQGKESKLEIILVDGLVSEIRVQDVVGKPPLTGRQLKDFKILVETFANDIVKSWVDYFVYNKSIANKRITRKL